MKQAAFPSVGSIAQKTILRCDPAISAREAALLMEKNNVSSVVLEMGGKLHIFTVEDLLNFIHGEGAYSTPLSDLSIRRLDCISDNEKLLVVLEHLESTGSSHLGVLDADDRLIGIVTRTDILTSIDPAILLERKKIGDMIIRSEPVMFTADWILEDVMHHFRRAEDAIIVVDEGKPIGIVTTKDVFGVLSSGDDAGKPLSEYMATPVITSPRAASINEAMLQLKQYRIKRAIVVDEGGQLAGVISQSELISYAYGAWINILKNHSSELHELVDMLEEKARSLEHLSVTDVLTGLGNRRLLQIRMDEEKERVRRYGAVPFSLVILDIDFFKQINDTHGHLVGDAVLKLLSTEINRAIRKIDTAVRWGGEEFAIMLGNTPLSAAAGFCERLRAAVERMELVNGIQLTISLGISEYVPNEEDFTLVERADRALYSAKRKGRNRVEVEQALKLSS
ncbi:MAG: diguanylate cyclase [Gammaproteobacteria bacterium]|nr:diguanylate cyclase [Gammaproteobacteria bacterium]MBU1625701.1 diguanylate cyclase [Gammaproteobacteria bacterium]MBU1980961.1 diguanylate cyclase [Gammaproteobacteria bacterium]